MTEDFAERTNIKDRRVTALHAQRSSNMLLGADLKRIMPALTSR